MLQKLFEELRQFKDQKQNSTWAEFPPQDAAYFLRCFVFIGTKAIKRS